MNKKKPKKLSLNAETLRILIEPQLEKALGGKTTDTGFCCTATFACSGCQPCA